MNRATSIMLLFMLTISSGTVKADLVFAEPRNLGPIVNSPSGEGPSCISPDGLEFYFSSDRPGGSGSYDIWITKRKTTDEDWGPPVNLGPTVNTGQEDALACISSDGLSLFFYSNRPGGLGDHDIYVTTRETVNDDWGTGR